MQRSRMRCKVQLTCSSREGTDVLSLVLLSSAEPAEAVKTLQEGQQCKTETIADNENQMKIAICKDKYQESFLPFFDLISLGFHIPSLSVRDSCKNKKKIHAKHIYSCNLTPMCLWIITRHRFIHAKQQVATSWWAQWRVQSVWHACSNFFNKHLHKFRFPLIKVEKR